MFPPLVLNCRQLQSWFHPVLCKICGEVLVATVQRLHFALSVHDSRMMASSIISEKTHGEQVHASDCLFNVFWNYFPIRGNDLASRVMGVENILICLGFLTAPTPFYNLPPASASLPPTSHPSTLSTLPHPQTTNSMKWLFRSPVSRAVTGN